MNELTLVNTKLQSEINKVQLKNKYLKVELDKLSKENSKLEKKEDKNIAKSLNYSLVIKRPNIFKYLSGLSVEQFQILFAVVIDREICLTNWRTYKALVSHRISIGNYIRSRFSLGTISGNS